MVKPCKTTKIKLCFGWFVGPVTIVKGFKDLSTHPKMMGQRWPFGMGQKWAQNGSVQKSLGTFAK